MPLGLYISVPFCRTKCTYCNFASDVFSRARFENYVARLCAEIEQAPETCRQISGSFDALIDSIYFGGGTPTLLDVAQLEPVFVTIRQNLEVQRDAEITVECAPGTLSEPMMSALARCGVNRVSLGVQSFVDQEARSVGRLHNRETALSDIARLRAAGIANINVDLIAGLPHQTRESWEESVGALIDTGVPHASIYMLEVDEDSRLGRELIAGGQKYHAHFVPDEDSTADLYERACERLNAAGIAQYEISNFAKVGFESRHNLKYWTRQPYLGFGVDAHSMLISGTGKAGVRFCDPDSLDKYLVGAPRQSTPVSAEQALEETFFLGLRLNRGVDLRSVSESFGRERVDSVMATIDELIRNGLLQRSGENIGLTPRGRVLSNEVFQKFIAISSDALVS
ncbi:MAG TPA: radical SAM family heme chaperone HemW [Terriglobales bacterium]